MTDLVLATPPVDLATVVDGWLANRRLAEHTRTAYRRDVLAWLAWCADRDLNPLDVTFLDANAYARDLEDPETGRAYAASTVARKMSAVSSWYDFLTKVRAITLNPVDGADRPSVDRDHSRTIGFSTSEAAALKREADLEPWTARLRTRALIRALLDLGLRVAEITGAVVGELGYDSGWRIIKLTLKGGKIRRRRIPPDLGAAIDAMLAERGELPPDAPLFATRTGRALTRGAVFRLVRRLARRAGIGSWDKVSPHSCRHAFATIALGAGVPLEEVQDAMGHADPRTTRRYDRDRHALHRDPSVRVADAIAASFSNHAASGEI
jgi:integrase/recombinase XerD